MHNPAVPPKFTSIIRWLHLTDLHVGTNNEAQELALASLVSAIELAAGDKSFNFVFLTGDLSFSGRRDEYSRLEKILIDPIRRLHCCGKAHFIATPGNHDIDCSIGYPPSWTNLGSKRQEKFFHNDESGKSIRADRAKAFDEYWNFVSRVGIASVNPLVEVATQFPFDISGRAVCIVPVITAFFSDKEIQDKGKAPAPIHAIRLQLAQGCESDSLPIVLGHHPPDWFLPDHDNQLHSLLLEKNALYLHGHEHYVRTRFGLRGLTNLGFGAAYQAPLEGGGSAKYRNSFAICELSESLDVQVMSWEGENGNWRPEHSLPGDFRDPSDVLPNGYRLTIPSTRVSDQTNSQSGALVSAMRYEAEISQCIWLAKSTTERWAALLVMLGKLRDITHVYKVATQVLPSGHCQFRIGENDGAYLVRAVSAQGDILSHEHLQAINTELDRQGYMACFVVTLGTLAEEADKLANQLKTRKALTVIGREEIIRGLVRNLPANLERQLRDGDPDRSTSSLLITDKGVALLVQGRLANSWFYLFDEDGVGLSESSSLVQEVRRELPTLRDTRYEMPKDTHPLVGAPRVTGVSHFARDDYLQKSFALFDEVKYAPLAALGFKFGKTSLSDIYVDASADVGGTTKTTHHITRAVSEFVGALKLPKSQQEQLEAQLRSKYGLSRTAEVGAARALYQRYNNVLVLGDPGSGKTCFVKHELLAYCDPPEEYKSWYAAHLPIYVQLAEAARLLDEGTDLIEVCEILSSRRGIPLPRAEIEKCLFEGRVAFFFDGLDEVGLIEKRLRLVSEVDALMRAHSQRGNRFVLSSRPAAIEPVDIPEAFTYLELKGLTETEISVLARRVFNVRVGVTENQQPSEDEDELVRRLLDDTKSNPGIARIARNPLLLTLLVLIYANSGGALSAKRHVVYSQAIKTLVSVRGRETREQQISEADLRTRLGALALAIFKRDVPEIPHRTEVVKLIAPYMPKKPHGRTQEVEADAYVQEIAEATGLLALHSEKGVKESELVTFMHFSFLEYYAAAGLLTNSVEASIGEYASNPRWRDVITLLFGIVSEQRDVSSLLQQVLSHTSAPEAITQARLLLAIDCAAECDVPPQQAQAILAEAIYIVMTDGAGQYSAELRSDIAKHLEAMFVSSGAAIDEMLAKGLRDGRARVAAAFADLIAHFGDDVTLSSDVCEAFEGLFEHDDVRARVAALFAIERRPELRMAGVVELARRALNGSIVEKHAALKAIAAAPTLQQATFGMLRETLDDHNPWIAKASAQCLIRYIFREGKWDSESSLIDKALQKLGEATQDTGVTLTAITYDADEWERMALSDQVRDVELAMRYAEFVRGEDARVYRVVMKVLRGTSEAKIKCASLDGLRACVGAVDLISLADTDFICSMLAQPHRSVRIAAGKLLGVMPDDEQVIKYLRRYLREGIDESGGDDDEKAEAVRALSNHVRRNARLRAQIIGDIADMLPRSIDAGFGDTKEQGRIVSLLSVCEAVGGIAESELVKRLIEFSESYRTPEAIRVQAIRAVGRIMEPSEDSARYVLKLLGKQDIRTKEASYSAAASFVGQCQRKSQYVRSVLEYLPRLRDELCKAWDYEMQRTKESLDPPAMVDVRGAISGIEALMISYEEIATRVQVREGHR